jgi:hypothetical protein
MLKITRILRSASHSGITELDNALMECLDKMPAKSLVQVADDMIAIGGKLAEKKLLNIDALKISLHKFKSKDWNILQVKYKKDSYVYHTEIVHEKKQMGLFL